MYLKEVNSELLGAGAGGIAGAALGAYLARRKNSRFERKKTQRDRLKKYMAAGGTVGGIAGLYIGRENTERYKNDDFIPNHKVYISKEVMKTFFGKYKSLEKVFFKHYIEAITTSESSSDLKKKIWDVKYLFAEELRKITDQRSDSLDQYVTEKFLLFYAGMFKALNIYGKLAFEQNLDVRDEFIKFAEKGRNIIRKNIFLTLETYSKSSSKVKNLESAKSVFKPIFKQFITKNNKELTNALRDTLKQIKKD